MEGVWYNIHMGYEIGEGSSKELPTIREQLKSFTAGSSIFNAEQLTKLHYLIENNENIRVRVGTAHKIYLEQPQGNRHLVLLESIRDDIEVH